MISALMVAVLLQTPAADPNSVTVFGKELWYQSVRGDEDVFVGTLERTTGRNQRNAYCLVMKEGVKTVTRELFVGEATKQLQPFVGRTVKVTGMAVDLKVDNRARYEIWPNRVEVDGGKGDDNIIARADYQAKMPQLSKIGAGAEKVVITSSDDFLKACNGSRDEMRKIQQALRVDDINFRREMLIIVTAGVVETLNHSVEILDVSTRGETMTVTWRLNKPDPKAVKQLKWNHPAQLVVVPRFDGQVKFVEK